MALNLKRAAEAKRHIPPDIIARHDIVECWKCRKDVSCLFIELFVDPVTCGRIVLLRDASKAYGELLRYAWSYLGCGERLNLRMGRSCEGGEYLANHCPHCQAIQGDWALMQDYLGQSSRYRPFRRGRFYYRYAPVEDLIVNSEIACFTTLDIYQEPRDLPMGLWLWDHSQFARGAIFPNKFLSRYPGSPAEIVVGPPALPDGKAPLWMHLSFEKIMFQIPSGFYMDVWPSAEGRGYFAVDRDENQSKTRLLYIDVARQQVFASKETHTFDHVYIGDISDTLDSLSKRLQLHWQFLGEMTPQKGSAVAAHPERPDSLH